MNNIILSLLNEFLNCKDKTLLYGYQYVSSRGNLHHSLNKVIDDWRYAAIINSYCATGSHTLNSYCRMPISSVYNHNEWQKSFNFKELLELSLKKLKPTSHTKLYRTESLIFSEPDKRLTWHGNNINSHIKTKQFFSTSQKPRNKPEDCISFEITSLSHNSRAFDLNPIRKIIDPGSKENEALYLPDTIFKITGVINDCIYKQVVQLKEIKDETEPLGTILLEENYWLNTT